LFLLEVDTAKGAFPKPDIDEKGAFTVDFLTGFCSQCLSIGEKSCQKSRRQERF